MVLRPGQPLQHPGVHVVSVEALGLTREASAVTSDIRGCGGRSEGGLAPPARLLAQGVIKAHDDGDGDGAHRRLGSVKSLPHLECSLPLHSF